MSVLIKDRTQYWGTNFGKVQYNSEYKITEYLFAVPRGSKLAGQNNSGPKGKRASRFYLGRKIKGKR